MTYIFTYTFMNTRACVHMIIAFTHHRGHPDRRGLATTLNLEHITKCCFVLNTHIPVSASFDLGSQLNCFYQHAIFVSTTNCETCSSLSKAMVYHKMVSCARLINWPVWYVHVTCELILTQNHSCRHSHSSHDSSCLAGLIYNMHTG